MIKNWIPTLALLVCIDFTAYVCRDMNRNARCDEGEVPAANYTVWYKSYPDDNGMFWASHFITDENGQFCWPGGYGEFNMGCATSTVNAGSTWPNLPGCPLFVYLPTVSGGPQ